MRTIIIISILLFSNFNSYSQTDWEWVKWWYATTNYRQKIYKKYLESDVVRSEGNSEVKNGFEQIDYAGNMKKLASLIGEPFEKLTEVFPYISSTGNGAFGSINYAFDSKGSQLSLLVKNDRITGVFLSMFNKNLADAYGNTVEKNYEFVKSDIVGISFLDRANNIGFLIFISEGVKQYNIMISKKQN